MKRIITIAAAVALSYGTFALAQVADDADGLYDSTSLVDTNSTTNTTSNVTSNNTNTNDTTINSTNTNTNTNTSTIDATNTNINTNTNNTTVNSTSTNTNVNTNNNILSGGTNNTNTNINTNDTTINQTTDSTSNITSNNTNTNNNNTTINQTTDSTINQTIDQNVTSNVTSNNTNTNTNTNTNNTTVDSTSNNTNTNNNNNDSNIRQEIISPPPSAIAPTIQSGGNDTCTVTYSAAVQTQILGASGGGHIRDLNCERLKNAKTLYNMGMKVAAVSLMCQDAGVYRAMEMAGTPCPFDGSIGAEAKAQWEANPQMQPTQIEQETRRNDKVEGAVQGILAAGLLTLLLGI